MKEKNCKQKELADYLGLNESAIANWKSGTTKSYQKHLAKIADFFDISMSELVEPSDTDASELLKDRSVHENRISIQNTAIFPTEIQKMYNDLSIRAKLEVQTFIIDKSEEEKGKKS